MCEHSNMEQYAGYTVTVDSAIQPAGTTVVQVRDASYARRHMFSVQSHKLRAQMKPMKLSLTILLAIACGPSAVASALADGRALDDYNLGVLAGICMSSRCQVFQGSLASDAPKVGEPVSLHVDEWWYGPDLTKGVIQVEYADFENSRCAGDGGCPVAEGGAM
jgi:hypothetical protein